MDLKGFWITNLSVDHGILKSKLSHTCHITHGIRGSMLGHCTFLNIDLYRRYYDLYVVCPV